MGEIVNLRQARKRRARQAREAEAEANRAKFGVSTSVREAQARDGAAQAKKLDGHRLIPVEPGDG